MLGNTFAFAILALLFASLLGTQAQDLTVYNNPEDQRSCMADVLNTAPFPCTAQDIYLSEVIGCVVSETGVWSCDPTRWITCREGSPNTIALKFAVQAKGPTRYDAGVYVATAPQPDAKTGSCCQFILKASREEIGNIPEGESPNLDGDECGDVNAYGCYYKRLILELPCQAAPGSMALNIPYCTTWSQVGKGGCYQVNNIVPGTGSKCNCGNATVGNVIVVSEPIIDLINWPTCYNPGSPVDLRFKVTNPSSSQVSMSISFPAVDTIKCCVGTNCDPTTVLTGPVNLASHGTLLCEASFIGEEIEETLTVTATATFPNQYALPTSESHDIYRISGAIESLTLSFAPDSSNPIEGTLNWVVKIKNTGADALVTIDPITGVTFEEACRGTFALEEGCERVCCATERIDCDALTADCDDHRTVDVEFFQNENQDCLVPDSETTYFNYEGRVCRRRDGNCDKPEVCVAQGEGEPWVCPDDCGDVGMCEDDGIACTDLQCCDEPSGWWCRHKVNHGKCLNCPCTREVCVATQGGDAWGDGCIHYFGNTIVSEDDSEYCYGDPDE